MSTNYPNGIINPFSYNFLPTWQLWKDFRFQSHQFKYMGVISEQMALKKLVEISNGDEQKAIRIVEQSISKEYKDFYQLKQSTGNGKSTKKQSSSNTKNETGSSSTLRERVQAEFNRRNGNWQQSGDEPHLKAV